MPFAEGEGCARAVHIPSASRSPTTTLLPDHSIAPSFPGPLPSAPLPLPRSEWVVNHHRDSMASHIGHSDMLAYCAVAEGEAIGRVKHTMLEKMLQPCGPPPPRTEVP